MGKLLAFWDPGLSTLLPGGLFDVVLTALYSADGLSPTTSLPHASWVTLEENFSHPGPVVLLCEMGCSEERGGKAGTGAK